VAVEGGEELAVEAEVPVEEVLELAVEAEPVVVPVREVEQEPGQVSAMGLVQVMELVQGQEWAWAQRLQWVLALMRLLAQVLELPLVQARLEVLVLVQVPARRSALEPTHPSVQAPVVSSGMEPVTAPLMGLETKASGLKMEQVSELQSNFKTHQSYIRRLGQYLQDLTAPVFSI
jgi:hypothetical protein